MEKKRAQALDEEGNVKDEDCSCTRSIYFYRQGTLSDLSAIGKSLGMTTNHVINQILESAVMQLRVDELKKKTMMIEVKL